MSYVRTKEHQDKINKALRGHVSWNRGLTKKDPRIARMAVSISATVSNKWKNDTEYRERTIIEYGSTN